MADDLIDNLIVDEKLSDNDEPKPKKRKKKIIKEVEDNIKETEDPKEDFLEKLDDYFRHNLSSIERETMKFGGKCFLTSNVNQKNLSCYLKEIMNGWEDLITKRENCKSGSPFIIVLASSALRAVELNREAAEFKTKNCKAAKLFAKHMKLKDQVTFLAKNDVHFAVGTPNRVSSLLELGSLSTDRLRIILIDWFWKDIKKRRIVNIPETKNDLFLLFQKHLYSCFGKDRSSTNLTKIALF